MRSFQNFTVGKEPSWGLEKLPPSCYGKAAGACWSSSAVWESSMSSKTQHKLSLSTYLNIRNWICILQKSVLQVLVIYLNLNKLCSICLNFFQLLRPPQLSHCVPVSLTQKIICCGNNMVEFVHNDSFVGVGGESADIRCVPVHFLL